MSRNFDDMTYFTDDENAEILSDKYGAKLCYQTSCEMQPIDYDVMAQR